VRSKLRFVRRGAALLLATMTAAALIAACDSGGGTGSQWPLGAAGRACQFLNYDTVAATLGVRFDIAGGASKDEIYTCALTRTDTEFPDLTLAVTETEADEVIFTATMIPSGGTRVADLGRIAYRVGFPAARGGGPGIEVGWLSTYGRLMIIRYTFPAGATSAQVNELTPKVITLAKRIEETEV
jgi:hypothetical protein